MIVHREVQNVRSAAILTTSYVTGTTIAASSQYNQLFLYCYFTIGSLTSAEIKIESTIDNTNWVQETNLSISGGTGTLNKGNYTITESGNFKIALPLSAHNFRVSSKGTGTTTSSSLQIDALLTYV